ncbi:MAG: RNA polymerase sigma factor [Clostridium sp.]
MKNDNELMDLVKTGDIKAFEEIVLKYRESAIKFAIKIINDNFFAEDIVQESFALIYINRARYRNSYSFKTYLFTIVRNKCIDYLRKKKECTSDQIETNSKECVEDIILKKEESKILKESFNKLKHDYQVAIYLLEYEEMSYKEIGKIMKKSVPQVKILIYRARKKMKLILEEVRLKL